jgi:hypothetical protein
MAEKFEFTEVELKELIEQSIHDALIIVVEWLAEGAPDRTLTARNMITNGAILPLEAAHASIN